MELTDILNKIGRLRERIKENNGEAITLNAKFDCGLINPILYQMKFDCIEFERDLINNEIDELEAEFKVKQLLTEIFVN